MEPGRRQEERTLRSIKGNGSSHSLTSSTLTWNGLSTGSTAISFNWLHLLDRVCVMIMYSSLIYSGLLQSVSFVTSPAQTAVEVAEPVGKDIKWENTQLAPTPPHQLLTGFFSSSSFIYVTPTVSFILHICITLFVLSLHLH